MGPALAPLALSAFALAHPSPDDEARCQQIREVRALAESHDLKAHSLKKLERIYCRERPRVDAHKQEHCRDLDTMLWLASTAREHVEDELKDARDLVCSGYAGAPRSWPSGGLAHSSSDSWYWPSGSLAISSSDTLYYPSGTLARSSSGAWYYPNGHLALAASGRWYTPDGYVVDENDLLHRACRQRHGGCRARLDELRYLSGDARTASLLALAWERLG